MFAPFTICEVLLEGVISLLKRMRVERPEPYIPPSSKLTEPSLTERVSDINTTCKVHTLPVCEA